MMLKKLQKIRDVLEELAFCYCAFTELGKALEEYGELAKCSTKAVYICKKKSIR